MAWEGSTRSARLPKCWHTKIRPRIRKRDGGICHVCKKPGADDVDHIEHGDDHSDANLAAIHRVPCHGVKSGGEGGRAAAARRRRRPCPLASHGPDLHRTRTLR